VNASNKQRLTNLCNFSAGCKSLAKKFRRMLEQLSQNFKSIAAQNPKARGLNAGSQNFFSLKNFVARNSLGIYSFAPPLSP
jgi:hypothetical protein